MLIILTDKNQPYFPEIPHFSSLFLNFTVTAQITPPPIELNPGIIWNIPWGIFWELPYPVYPTCPDYTPIIDSRCCIVLVIGVYFARYYVWFQSIINSILKCFLVQLFKYAPIGGAKPFAAHQLIIFSGGLHLDPNLLGARLSYVFFKMV